MLDNGTLLVRQVAPRDAGVYRCVGLGAGTGGSSAQTFAAQLTIASQPLYNNYCDLPLSMSWRLIYSFVHSYSLINDLTGRY